MSKNVNITVLKDLESGETDAIILSNTTTKEEIETKISDAKEKFGMEWNWENLVDALPSDCSIYDKWSRSFEVAYY